MTVAAQLDVVLGGDNSGAVAAIDGTNRSLAGAGVAVTAWGAVGVAALKNWTSGAINLEQTWANTAAVTGQSTQQVIDNYTALSADLAVQFGKSQQDIATGIYNIAQAGDYTVAQTNAIIKAATEGAAAGLTTVDVATDGITSALNAYKYGINGVALSTDDLNRINDINFRTVAAGKITYEELNSVIGDNAPLAAQLGVSYEEVGAAYAMATSQGISYSEVSTQLNAIMSGLLKPTTALTTALEAHGYTSGQDLLAQEGLAGALKFVTEATGGQSDALAELFPNIRATKGLTALLNGDFDTFLNMMKDAPEVIDPVTGEVIKLGATQEALNRTTNTTGYQISKLTSSLGVLGNQIGTTMLPFVKAVAVALTALVAVFIGLPEPIKQFIGALVGLSSAGFLVAGAFIAAQALFGGIGAAILAIATPILIVAGALALLSVAWTKNWGGIRTATDRAVTYLQGKFRSLGLYLNQFAKIFDLVATGTNPLAGALYTLSVLSDDLAGRFPFLERPLSALSDAFRVMFDVVKQAADAYDAFRVHVNPGAAVLEALGATIQNMSDRFGPFATAAEHVGDVLVALGLAAGDVGDVLQALMERNWGEAWEEAKDAFSDFRNAFRSVGNVASDLWNILSDAIASVDWGALWETVGDELSSTVSTITDRLKGIDWTSALGNDISFDFGHAVGEQIAKGINALTLDDLLDAQALMSKIEQGLLQAIGGGIALAGIAGAQLASSMTGILTGVVEGVNWGQIQTTLTTRWRDVLTLFATSIGGVQAQLGQVIGDWITSQIGTINWQPVTDALLSGINRALQMLFFLGVEFPTGKFIVDALMAKFGNPDWSALTSGVKNGISGAISRVRTEVSDFSQLAQNITGAISLSIFNKISAGADFGTVILQGIREKINGLALSAAAFPDLATSIGEAIADAIKNQVESWSGETVKSAITSKVNGLTATAGDFASFATSIASAIWEGIKSAATNWDWMSLVPSWARPFVDAVTPKLSRDFSADASAAIQGASGKNDFSALTSSAAAVVTALRQLATEATGAMATVSTAITSGVTTSNTSLVALGVGFTTVQTVITTSANALATAVQTTVTQMTTSLVALGVAFATAQTFVATMMTQMVTAITTAMVQAGVAVTTGATVMIATLTSFATTAGNLGKQAGNDFSRGITEGVNVAVRAAQRGALDILSALTLPSLYSSGYSTGSSLGQGIADGLASQLQAVASAAAALVGAANSAATAKGEINSPSRLTKREVGVPLAQGIIAGMTSQKSMVGAAFAALLPTGARIGAQVESVFSASGNSRTARNLARTGGGDTYNVALTGDDLLALLRKAERGASLADNVGRTARTVLAGTGVRLRM